MSSGGSITPANIPAVETGKKNQADDLGDNDNKIGDKEMKSEAHSDTTPVDTGSQDNHLKDEGNPTSGSPEAKAKSNTPGMSIDNSRLMHNKENEGPELSRSQIVPHIKKDHSVEFAEWKGSSNPSCPKWGPPPYLQGSSDTSNTPTPSGSTARSNGICPGMGAWPAR
ncbi:hypothetical protein SLS53_003503 [Cytospora paraplurivora]|uniref:Uncharacterized protein n=1 Tax=Cytospora paraplurivora TaxID=2898453 RepID=A0AAN9YJ01_9PEZI